MVKNHMKRIAAPKSWPLERKERTFVARPNPGRAFALAMPLSHVMKKLIKKGETTKEVRHIMFNEGVLINGKREYDHRRPVGFMDVISFPSINEHHRMTITSKGLLAAVNIDAKEASKRLVKVRGKTRLGNRLQLNFDDGTNLLVDKDDYATGDSLLITDSKVSKRLRLEPGAAVILTGGRHHGRLATVKAVEDGNIVLDASGTELSTARRYAFVTGAKEPEVTIR
jgi:small subunit ribosomal protein S4e